MGKRKTLVLLLTLASLIACAHRGGEYAVTRMGREHAAKPEGCPISWLNLTADEAYASHEMIGTVQIVGATGTSELSEGQRTRIELEACKLGGDSVTLASGGQGAFGRGAAVYWVLLPKESTPEKPTAQQS